MTLEKIMLNEVSQTQRAILYASTSMKYLTQRNSPRQNNGSQGLWGEGPEELFLNSYRVFVGDRKKVSETGDGGNCTTL